VRNEIKGPLVGVTFTEPVPDSAGWEHSRDGKWRNGLLLNLAIGQGELLLTPLQLALMMAEVSQDGHAVRPHLVQAVRCRPEEHPARLRDGHGAHRLMKHIGIVEVPGWHSGILPEIEPIRSIFPCRAQGASTSWSVHDDTLAIVTRTTNTRLPYYAHNRASQPAAPNHEAGIKAGTVHSARPRKQSGRRNPAL